MPTASSNVYSITFRPTIDEFMDYHSDFMDRVASAYPKAKYVLSYEKAGGDSANHIQGFIHIERNVRADSFRRSFQTKVIGDMVIAHPDVAVKLNPITRDVESCIGYTLKEQKDLSGVVYKGYEEHYLLECKEVYRVKSADKRVKMDKVKVNMRCLPEIVKRYCDVYYDKLSSKHGLSKRDQMDSFDVYKVLCAMGQDDYYMMPIILSKDIDKVCLYLKLYLTGKLIEGGEQLII